MIRSMYRSSDGKITQNLTPEQTREALKDEGGDLWVDITPSAGNRDEAIIFLKGLFGFHPLSLDDAFQETHVPRIDEWPDYLYIVLHALDLEINRTLETQELDIFAGRNYLVTIHEQPIRPLEHLWDQCSRGGQRRLASGPDYLLYSLIDVIVADYMQVVDGLDDEIDELEHEVFHHSGPQTISRIFRLRRTILKLRRMLGYLREVTNRLARDDNPVIDTADRI